MQLSKYLKHDQPVPPAQAASDSMSNILDRSSIVSEKLKGSYSFMFDADWYAAMRGIGGAGETLSKDALIDDFMNEAQNRTISPSVWFDTEWFIANYHLETSSASAIDALYHYFDSFSTHEKTPSPYIIVDWYSERYLSVGERIREAKSRSIVEDYMLFGGSNGLRANGWFDEIFYRAEHPEIERDIISGRYVSGLHHFLLFGRYLGFDPDPRFSSLRYFAVNRDVAEAFEKGSVVSAFDHWIRYGAKEGRNIGNDVVDGMMLYLVR